MCQFCRDLAEHDARIAAVAAARLAKHLKPAPQVPIALAGPQFPRDEMLPGPLAAALLPWQRRTLAEHLRAASGPHNASTTPPRGIGVGISDDPGAGPGPWVRGLSPRAKIKNLP